MLKNFNGIGSSFINKAPTCAGAKNHIIGTLNHSSSPDSDTPGDASKPNPEPEQTPICITPGGVVTEQIKLGQYERTLQPARTQGEARKKEN